eukprot:TRINITY_DN11589_c0_g1_i1.p1 TRINITY_DN11589_c0_g1~~TRINITY_DN11589_c0_g1_i1.p1  ORF type:complete len:717 (+),score=135.30 TRINITY_DN11589_c0_g1_i1:163-2313(+)
MRTPTQSVHRTPQHRASEEPLARKPRHDARQDVRGSCLSGSSSRSFFVGGWVLVLVSMLLVAMEYRRVEASAELQELKKRHEKLRAAFFSRAIARPGGRDGSKGSCLGWRATDGCGRLAGRLPAADLTCEAEVPAVATGFCECVGGRQIESQRCAAADAAVPGFRTQGTCAHRCGPAPSQGTPQTVAPTPAPSKRDPLPRGCVSWRQTGMCTPDGPREPHRDLPCDAQVPGGVSGYCECTGGARVLPSSCQPRPPLVCAAACAQSDTGAAAARQVTPPVATPAPPQLTDRPSTKEPVARAASTAGRANLECHGWKQTGGCSAQGQREPHFDKSCGTEIPSGASGFCLCGNAGRQWRVNSDCSPRRPLLCFSECGVPTPKPPPPPPTPVPPAPWTEQGRLTALEGALDKGPAGSAPSLGSDRVPWVLHQTWATDSVPQHLLAWTRGWLRQNPEWRYEFWDDARMDTLLVAHLPKYAPVLNSMRPIHKADLGRVLMMYLYGGVYADMDMEGLLPLSALALAADEAGIGVLVAEENVLNAVLLEGKGIDDLLASNFVLMSRPRHPVWLCYLHRAFAAFEQLGDCDPVSCTGPRMLDSVLRAGSRCEQAPAPPGHPPSAGTAVVRLPWQYFSSEPALWNVDNLRLGCATKAHKGVEAACAMLRNAVQDPARLRSNRSFGVHHWQCSWCRQDQALARTGSLRSAVLEERRKYHSGSVTAQQ